MSCFGGQESGVGRVALAILAALAIAGCGSKKKPAEAEPEEVPADVGFLVEACTGAGLPAADCRCVGEQAQKGLGKELVDKMRAAPPDDDLEALQRYYTGAEVQRTMAFLDSASAACGIEEAL